MSAEPQISIIIPVHNRRSYLDACIESIRAQDFEDYEIIVIDDASTENLRPVEAAVEVYCRSEVSGGPGHARNVGSLASRGTFLVFLDSDTQLRPGTLGKLPALFSSDPSIGALGGSGPPDKSGADVEFILGKNIDYFGRSSADVYRPGEHLNGLYDCDHIETAFLAVRRDAFWQIGGFDPCWRYLGEDRDFCLRLKDAGYRVVACLETRAIHHRVGSSGFEEATYLKMYYSKTLQVTLKNRGVGGGLRWLIGNYRTTLNPSFTLDLGRAFGRYRELAARRDVDHLSATEVDRFYSREAATVLDHDLPFPVRSPLPTPRNFFVFVNALCNALCDHCFIIHDTIPQQDRRQIPLENILKLFQSVNRPVSISLTGGEPFLRKDLKLMLMELMKLPHTREISVNSNASTPGHIETICREVCESSDKPLYLQLSLDGLEERHDDIRKIPKGFKKVLDTCARANQLQQSFSNFGYVVAITVMKQNLSQMEPLVDLLEELGYRSKISVVRGNDFSTFGVPADILEGKYNPNAEVMVDAQKTRETLARIADKHPGYFDRYQKRKLQLMLDTFELRRRLIPCYAGYEDAVIYNDGGVGICEQVVPFGNLEKWDWDFTKAWNSTEAMEHRLRLTSCACIHGCNISTSVGMEARAAAGVASLPVRVARRMVRIPRS